MYGALILTFFVGLCEESGKCSDQASEYWLTPFDTFDGSVGSDNWKSSAPKIMFLARLRCSQF